MPEATLPARLLTASSTRETAIAFLKHISELLPGFWSGSLALSSQAGTRLHPLAYLQRTSERDVVNVEEEDSDLISTEDGRLLYRAYLKDKPLLSTENLPAAGMNSVEEPGVTETRIVFPLHARHGKIGSVLLRYRETWPNANERAILKRKVDAVGNLLSLLQREELFSSLERSKQQWEATLDSLDTLLYVHSPDGELLKVNRTLAEYLGTTAADLMRHPAPFYAHFPVCCPALPADTHLWHSTPLNASFEVTRTPVMDRSGKHIGCVHILRNVTERLKMESQLRQSERLAALGEMVSGVAHELNGPLAAILGYAERLTAGEIENRASPERLQNMTRKIGMEAERAAHIVRDLLSFARPQQREMLPLDLNDVLRCVAELCEEDLKEDNVSLRLATCEPLPLVLGNSFDIQRVLFNMIKNARQAICEYRSDGCITLTTGICDGAVQLTVEDDGPGIPLEHRERLLEPFFTTKRMGQGTGLGLSICYGILKAHDAILSVVSEVGQGAAFEMCFPIASEVRLSGTKPQVHPSNRPASRRDRSRIAIVDDEPLIRETLGETLEEAGYEVVCFSSPVDALAALDGQLFDLILTDMHMPALNGMQFYDEVRARHPAMLKSLLFITGDTLAVPTQQFFMNTGAACLRKPFRHSELLERLEEMLSYAA